MKHCRLLSCAALVVSHLSLIISSCTTDVYDKGDGAYSLMQAEMADVHVDGDLQADYLTTDDGERLRVTSPFTNSWMNTPDSTYRAVAYFDRVADGAEVKALNRVGVTIPKRIKDMKTDPVRFESVWTGRSGHYLNVSIYVLLGSTEDENAIQTLGCHNDTLMANADGTATQHLTLYHDQGGVPEYYSQRTYISIPLDSIHADSVALSVNTYDGIVIKTVRLTRQ